MLVSLLGSAASRYAAKRVLSFGFVGITELWKASICLWHRQMGMGEPDATEFSLYRVGKHHATDRSSESKSAAGTESAAGTPPNVRHGRQKDLDQKRAREPSELLYDSALLEGFVDPADEVVYEAALKKFETDLDLALGSIGSVRPTS